jgi:hypothetical protein
MSGWQRGEMSLPCSWCLGWHGRSYAPTSAPLALEPALTPPWKAGGAV